MLWKQKKQKNLVSLKNVCTFAPLLRETKSGALVNIRTHGEVGEWLKPTVC